MVDKYYLKTEWQKKWQHVTKKQFIQAERDAGFHPKLSRDDPDYMNVCATAGFGADGIQGKIS